MADGEDVIDCYCGIDEDEGLMVNCERCNHWQHGECVNLCHWTVPLHYICPTCLGLELECTCGNEGDYQHALIQCSMCHLYQHKRHVGFGLGKNPASYLCASCSPSYGASRVVHVEPILGFFPSFSDKLVPEDVASIHVTVPPGKLLVKLREFNKPISPVDMISQIYTFFRDLFFRSHPFLQFVRITKHHPQDCVNDCATFLYYVLHACKAMARLAFAQVIQFFDHLIALDIYKQPLSPAVRDPIVETMTVIKVKDQEDTKPLRLSERALDQTGSSKSPNLKAEAKAKLALVAGKTGSPSVITRIDLRQGELICSCCGLISVLEEVDYKSTLPQHTIYRLTGRNLFLSPPIAHYSPMFWRIRRSLASNCELKLYRDDGEWKVGLFATEVTLMPELIKKRESIQIVHNSSVVISAGGELTLPFDVTPVHIRADGEWKTGKHQHMAMRPKDIAPIRPSSSQTGDFDMHFARASKPPQAPGVTLQGLFGDSMIPSFIIDPTARSKLTRSRYPLPRELVSLPMPGKKS
jgi:hypothetical protein